MKRIRKWFNRKFFVKQEYTNLKGKTWKIVIKKPKESRLYKIGFKNDNRGYRKKHKGQTSVHVLPSALGWELHVDRNKKGKHTVVKKSYAEVYVHKFLEQY